LQEQVPYNQVIAGEDPNFLSREMREAVDKGMFPKWKMFIQVMKEAEGYQKPVAFDCTKVWKHDEYPLIEVGEIEVNRWPEDYHTTVESVAFSPARVVPGIGFSPDKLLQGRLPLYDITQAHRLGPNHQQLPINCPFAKTNQFHAFQGTHPVTETNKNHWPHYYGSLFGGLQPDPDYKEPALATTGPADYYPPPNEYSDEDIYLQPREFLQATSDADRSCLVDNLGYALSGVDPKIVTVLMGHFEKIDSTFARLVKERTTLYLTRKQSSAGRMAAERIRMELGNPPASIVEGKSTLGQVVDTVVGGVSTIAHKAVETLQQGAEKVGLSQSK